MPAPSHIDLPAEGDLWNRFCEGDLNAFEALFRQYDQVLFRYGYSIVPDRELVKDCLQDFFVTLWNSRSRLQGVRHVKVYLLVSFRRALMRRKRSQRLRVVPMGEGLELMPDPGLHAGERMMADEEGRRRMEIMSQAVASLPARQREAVLLRYYEGLEYESITQIMALNYQVVRNLIYRAMKQLKHKLADFSNFILLSILPVVTINLFFF